MIKLVQNLLTTLKVIKLTANLSIQAIIKAVRKELNPKLVDEMLNVWSDKLCKIIKAKISINNPNKIYPIHGQPTIILCNHASLLDIPFSFQVFRKFSIRMLAKKELQSVPLMGRAMIAAGFPFINRKNRAKALEDLKIMKSLLKNNIVIWAYPEGTRSKNGKIQSLKKGIFISAIEMQAKLIPIYISGAHNMLGPNDWVIKTGGTIKINVGPEFGAEKYSVDNKDKLIGIIQDWFQKQENTN